MNTQPEVRIKTVEKYLKSGESLRKISEKLSISRITLGRWARWYKEGGRKNLKRKKPYRRPWNRPSKEVEEKVMLTKERDPALTLKKAQKILEEDGIRMSLKGIWGIWKRYALTGRSKEDPYAPFGSLTPEIKDSLQKIKELLKDGKAVEASGIVNILPSFPKDSILKEIPEDLLTPRRQLDRLYFLFGEIPFPDYYRKTKKIRKALEKKNLLYSSIFAGLREILALCWIVAPAKELKLITLLKERAKGTHDTSLQYLLSLHEGRIYTYYLNGKRAKESVRECIKLLRFLPYSLFFDSTGSLLTSISDYKKATFYYQKALQMKTDETNRRLLLYKLALTHVIAGRYRESKKYLQYDEGEKERNLSLSLLIKADCAFGKGDILKASFFYHTALEESERGQLRNFLHASSLGIAVIQAALGKSKDAKILLHKYLPLFRKSKMETEILMRNILLRKKILINKQLQEFPMFLLLSHLQNGRYKRALRCARNNDLMGLFHRMIVFFPESLLAMLEKGKDTGLPRAILNLPVFRKEIPVYTVKFLGILIVHKNQKYLPVKFRPKDTSFLAYVASQREKYVPLEKIYKNFWPNSKNAARNLAHLLVRIRKSLMLPSYYLYVKEGRLFFDCYFTTDYGEYQEHLAQAKALLRAGEWGFAKREFIRAFKLFRGKPFKKMYDDWSDDKRLEILFSYETEVLSFAKELKKRGRKKEAVELLKKAKMIVHHSDEIKDLLRS